MSAERTRTEEVQAEIAKRLVDAQERMEKSLEALHKELMTIRTGRASPALVERLNVEQYGSLMPLQSVAGISAPEARLLVIKPYDKNAIGAIEKAIQTSDLGLTPNNDGEVIRINLPQLTEERRREMVKQVHHKAEEARISVRNIRRDEVDALRKLEKEGHVSKDEVETAIGDAQKLTDKFIGAIDDTVKKKEAEVLEV
jgi:ribosome recycling factor